MKPETYFSKLAKTIFLMFACCAIFVANASVINACTDSSLSKETKKELNRARQATARYHNIDHAIADGYIDINVFFPNMGYHYLKPEILDADFEPEKPE